MTNKKKIVLLGIGAALVIGLTLCLFIFMFSDNGNKCAYIYSEGTLLYCIELKSESKEIRIETDSGYNVIRLKDGKIGVIEADCPDKTCIKSGFTDSAFLPVICMPHRLEIVIKSDFFETDGVSR